MLLDSNLLLGSLARELHRLQAQLADSDVEASAGYALINALQLLRNRESGDVGAIRAQLDELATLLARLEPDLSHALAQSGASLTGLRSAITAARLESNLRAAEFAWRQVMQQFQSLAATCAASSLASDKKAALSRTIVAWEIADLLRQSTAGPQDPVAANNVDITAENLAAYLRNRLSEPDLKVTACKPLPGGFGKQTILFEVSGKAMDGDYVMRRDLGARPTVANDCHLVRQEFPVIKAAFARGFPAPDALWVDTEHKLLPGGDFIVMRRAPGALAGSFFGARAAIPPGLADSLADITARLHALPPLLELGNLTDSIRTDLWDLPRSACVERYIRNWYQLFVRSEHIASPGLVSIYGWLFDNVPKRDGRAVLLHGDIGFNNFLFDGDRLSAVLDWEFAHIGDPAEDLGYVKVTTGAAVDWERLMARYRAAGGDDIDTETLRYFQVWAYARNGTAANLLTALFAHGHTDDLKVPILPATHLPNFLKGAQAIIDSR